MAVRPSTGGRANLHYRAGNDFSVASTHLSLNSSFHQNCKSARQHSACSEAFGVNSLDKAPHYQQFSPSQYVWQPPHRFLYPQALSHFSNAHYNPYTHLLTSGASLPTTRQGSLWPQEMSGVPTEYHARDWSGQEVKKYSQDMHEWSCPGLIIGADEDNSPTTSLSSWSPFSPSSNPGDAKIVFPSDGYGFRVYPPTDAHSPHSQVAQSAESLSEKDRTIVGSNEGTQTSACPLTNQSMMRSNVDAWQWEPASNVHDHMQNCSWDTLPYSMSHNPLLAAGHATGIETFPAFNSEFASQQLEIQGYAGAHQSQSASQQEGHIVPGLLFNGIPEDPAFDRAMSEASSAPDSAFDSDCGIESMPSAAAVLPSQNDDSTVGSADYSASRNTPLSKEKRNDRDMYLLQSRRSGLSYKEIKRRGGFTEAESTLRGRIRILSKPKHERVRKPQWLQSDIILLRQAVRAYVDITPHYPGSSSNSTQHFRGSRHQNHNMPKPPWKKVAEWMRANGASYPFAPATCAKKWEQVHALF